MTHEQREAAARAVLSFLERSDELTDSDELRLTLELRRRGRPVRRLRYAAVGGMVRTFVRSLVGSAKPKSTHAERKSTDPDLIR